MWTRLITLRTGISGVFLWTQQRAFGFHKRQQITRWATISFPVRTLLPVIVTRIYKIYTGRNVKPVRLRCTKPLVIREDRWNTWRTLVGKPLGKRSLERPIRTYENNSDVYNHCQATGRWTDYCNTRARNNRTSIARQRSCKHAL
jgi:hypothetical protein